MKDHSHPCLLIQAEMQKSKLNSTGENKLIIDIQKLDQVEKLKNCRMLRYGLKK